MTADLVDPVLDPFSIAYDHTQAVEADIGAHTVAYTVRSVDYAGIVSDLAGTFTFTVACPDNVMTSTLDTPTLASSTYDLASGTT